MGNRNFFVFVLMLAGVAQMAYGSTLSLTCAVGGVTLERYDNATYGWKPAGTLPRTFTVTQNTLVQIRANAVGYKEFATAICVNTAGTKTFNVVLEPDGIQNTIPLFAIGGTVTSRSGLYIAAGDYIVKTVNLTRYRTPDGAGQGGQDSNPIFAGGYYSNTLANFGANGTVGTGDKIYTGVFTPNLRRCLGYKSIVVKDADIAYGGVEMNLTIK